MEVFSSVHDAPRDTSVPIADVHPSVVSQAVRPTSQLPADCPYCGTHFKQARNIQRHLDRVCKSAPKGARFSLKQSPMPLPTTEPKLHTAISCPHCAKPLAHARNLKRHLNTCPVVKLTQIESSASSPSSHTSNVSRPVLNDAPVLHESLSKSISPDDS